MVTRREMLAMMAAASGGNLTGIPRTGSYVSKVKAAEGPYSESALTPMSVIDGDNAKVYINSVCVTQKGSWLVSFTFGKQHPRHCVMMRRSTDRGQTWQPRQVVYDPGGDLYDSEMGQFLAVPNPLGPKRVRRIYQFHIIKDTRKGVRFGRLAFTLSDADGRTWVGPRGVGSVYEVNPPSYALAPNNYGWHLMGPGLVLSNGGWMLPMNVSTDPKALGDIRSELVFLISPNILTEPDPRKLVFEFYPRPPHGVAAPLDSNPQQSLAQEPQVVELSDKRLMAVMRTGNGHVAYTISKDFGRSWVTPAEPLRRKDGGELVLNPNCPAPFTKLSGGRYALMTANNDGTANGGKTPFDYMQNRNPVFASIGREVPGAKQPVWFSEPRLLCHINGFKPEIKWRDLTYGALIEDKGEYFHFYNAVWSNIQVNRVDPRKLTAPKFS